MFISGPNVTQTFFVLHLFPTWRYTDLECIHSQLKSSKVNNMAKLLEAVESSYSPAFTNMQQDILAGNQSYFFGTLEKLNLLSEVRHVWLRHDLRWFITIFFFTRGMLWLNWLWSHIHSPALKEAKDICTYLNPLQRLFEDIESADFPEIRGQIGPLMHTVCLVWANSSYYNTPQRLIVLLQETCNLLIQQVSSSFFSVQILFSFFCSNDLCC